MKARDLAEQLLKTPDLDVAVSKFGGENKWPVTGVIEVEHDESVDSSLLGERFLLIESD